MASLLDMILISGNMGDMKPAINPGSFGDSEVNLLSQIVREAYSDTLATDTWTRVLDMIGGVVAYAAAGAGFANVQTGRLDNRIVLKAGPELLKWFDEHYGAIQMITNVALARKLSIWRPSDVIGKREMETSELHQSLLKGHGFGEPICMTCGSATGISARLWFLREKRKSDFSERDRFLLGLLQPHFCTALSIAKNLLQGDVYRESWMQTRIPRFVIDASGHILEMNIRAVELTGDGDGRDDLARVEAIAGDMIAQHATYQNVEYDGIRCRASLSEVVFPNAPTTYILGIDTAADMRNLMRRSMLDAGCSEREAEVCMMLVHGESNHEIAETLFIAECTVKDHVTSIFEKLGVTKRSAVVPRLLGV